MGVLTFLDTCSTVPDMGVIRGTGLLNYRELVTELGGDADQLLRAAGVRPGDDGDPDVFISYRSLVLAVESAAQATDSPDFGRRLARRQGIQILGPVGVAARTAPTMGEALRICSVYLSAYSPAISVSLEPDEAADRQFFPFRILARDTPPAPQTIELSLGVALEVFRYLQGQDYHSLNVKLPHTPMGPVQDYRDYYGCPVFFSCREAGHTLRSDDLNKPVSGDAQAHDAIVRYLEGIVSTDEGTMSAPVRRLVQQLLPTGAVTMALVARQFALHPKTFQRRLAAEGTTFGELVEEIRRELTEHYLRDTDLGLTQIARELGYAEQSVLTRSSNRWFGLGPSALREKLRSST